MRMLRRAMKQGGFDQGIFICHTPIVLGPADRILSIGDGGVVVGNP
jgi:hypothetical protein